jgi:4'-phosphopantetheinyl transferase
MLELVVASLDSEAEPLAGLLSEDERRRSGRFVFERDRRRYTVARARLRQLLGERLGAAPQSLQLAYSAHGKPALARRPGQRDLRFNVSHCGDIAAYAFTEGREVGVDVEEVRVLPDADEVAMRFFSQRERAAYLSLPASERPQGFFNCWTRKEAFVKAIGDGLSHPLETLDVSLAPAGWVLSSFVPAAGMVGAVAVQSA